MKFDCTCGWVIHDGADNNPDKGKFISARVWFDLLDSIDAAIEHPGRTARGREASCMKVRTMMGRAARSVWQCCNCGRLWFGQVWGIALRVKRG